MKDEPTTLRCGRCASPLRVFLDKEQLYVGCEFRGCPLTHIGPATHGLLADAIQLATKNRKEPKP